MPLGREAIAAAIARRHLLRMDTDAKYQLLLRRELIRAQARLKRAERERDALLEENRQMRQLLREHGVAPPKPAKRK